MSVSKIKIFLDLDKTIWDTFDKYGNQIWAKQLVGPLTLKKQNIIVDDVFSKCILRKDVLKFVNYFSLKKNFSISYITNGKYFGLPNRYQSSLIALSLFKLNGYFNSRNYLLYKTASKAKILSSIPNIKILFDDNIKIIKECSKIKNTIVIDSNDINWKYQIQNVENIVSSWRNT
tara:strand:+ start:52 stop:576 length:525 start_codon:yes stop_codon:yes gene_type:complete